MAFRLSAIVGQPETLLTSVIQRLELASGNPGNDINLLQEMAALSRSAVVVLGLDPTDTTAKELEKALDTQAHRDIQKLSKGPTIGTTFSAGNLLKPILDEYNVPLWVVKKSVYKKLLASNPPSHTMKFLNFRSANSMLKNHPLQEIAWLAWHLEPPKWRGHMRQAYKLLGPQDFEMRQLEPHPILAKFSPSSKLKFGHMPEPYLGTLYELGWFFYVAENSDSSWRGAIKELDFFSEEVNSNYSVSAFLQFVKFHPNFGELVWKVCRQKKVLKLKLANLDVTWDDVFRATRVSNELAQTVGLEGQNYPCQKTEELVPKIWIQLAWWSKFESTIFAKERLVACDLVSALNLENSWRPQRLERLQQKLWQELIAEYMGSKRLTDQIIIQLDNFLSSPETISNINSSWVE